MRGKVFALSLFLAVSGPPASAQQTEYPWAGGLGLEDCKDLEQVPGEELDAWLFGYWTGANLYLGGGDLCEERADLTSITAETARNLIKTQCQQLPEAPIVMAAFNALKSMQKITGSRAAKCGED